jgi:hypothetical protein
MKRIAFILIFFSAATAYTQKEKVKVGNNVVTGTVDTRNTVQNIELKRRVIVPKQAIVFNLGYNFPIVNNSLIKSDFWNKKTGTGLEFGIDFRHQFQKKEIDIDDIVISKPNCFAIGVGLGISYFHKSAGFDNYSEKLSNYSDKDGDKCTVNLNYRNVNETVNLAYLDIPLYLEIGKPSQVKTSVSLKLGFKASLLIFKKFEQDGKYTSTGYYEHLGNVTLDNVDVLGYFNNKSCYDNNFEHKLSPFVLWGSISGGVNFPFYNLEKNKSAKWILRVGFKLDYSLTPVSKAMEESYFKGSTFRLNQINMLSGDGSRIFFPGVSVGLIYCL